MSLAPSRPKSAPSADSNRNEGRSTEGQFLSVNRGPAHGSLSSNSGHQATASSSGTAELSLEQNYDRRNPETASGAPSSGGSSENDPWIRKNLLTLGKLTIADFLVLSEMTKAVSRRRGYPRLFKLADTPRCNVGNCAVGAGGTRSSK